MENLFAGLMAGIPIAIISRALMWVRSTRYVPELKAANEDIAGWDDQTIAMAFTGGIAMVSLGFGLLAGWAYGLVATATDNAPLIFAGLALFLGLLTTVFSLTLTTPMLLERVLLNIFFSLGFGFLVPLLGR
jgi:hypothetical protein